MSVARNAKELVVRRVLGVMEVITELMIGEPMTVTTPRHCGLLQMIMDDKAY